MAKVNTKTNNQKINSVKETASKILENQGKTYEKWLEEAHIKLIFENLGLVNEGLELRKDLNSKK